MRIVFFTELSHAGGVDTFLANIVSSWPRADDELLILGNAKWPGLSTLCDILAGQATVKSHRVPVYGDLTRNRSKLARYALAVMVRPLLAGFGYFKLRLLFKRIQPDRLIVVAGGYPGGDSIRLALLAWAHSSACHRLAVLNIHNLIEPASRLSLFSDRIDTYIAKRCAALVTVSKASLDTVRKRPGLLNVPSTWIHNGLEDPGPNMVDPSIRTDFGVPENKSVIVMLATYEQRKGHSFFLNIFKRIIEQGIDAVVVICGQGSESEIEKVKNQVVDLGIERNVVLHGYRKDAKRLLTVADIVVVPSQDAESLPYIAIEALAYGVPIVACSVGGLPEIITNGEGGWCVSVRDETQFEQHLRCLLNDRDLRLAQGKAGRSHFENRFTDTRMSIEYMKILN
jgi:glycosyltransferase involved in cell wall biosynthesis